MNPMAIVPVTRQLVLTEQTTSRRGNWAIINNLCRIAMKITIISPTHWQIELRSEWKSWSHTPTVRSSLVEESSCETVVCLFSTRLHSKSPGSSVDSSWLIMRRKMFDEPVHAQLCLIAWAEHFKERKVIFVSMLNTPPWPLKATFPSL